MIVVGQHWQTGPWRSTPREIVIDAVLDADEEISFHFTDREQTSSCSRSTFMRTYVEAPS